MLKLCQVCFQLEMNSNILRRNKATEEVMELRSNIIASLTCFVLPLYFNIQPERCSTVAAITIQLRPVRAFWNKGTAVLGRQGKL